MLAACAASAFTAQHQIPAPRLWLRSCGGTHPWLRSVSPQGVPRSPGPLQGATPKPLAESCSRGAHSLLLSHSQPLLWPSAWQGAQRQEQRPQCSLPSCEHIPAWAGSWEGLLQVWQWHPEPGPRRTACPELDSRTLTQLLHDVQAGAALQMAGSRVTRRQPGTRKGLPQKGGWERCSRAELPMADPRGDADCLIFTIHSSGGFFHPASGMERCRSCSELLMEPPESSPKSTERLP